MGRWEVGDGWRDGVSGLRDELGIPPPPFFFFS